MIGDGSSDGSIRTVDARRNTIRRLELNVHQQLLFSQTSNLFSWKSNYSMNISYESDNYGGA